MITGRVRDGFPRVLVDLPGRSGDVVRVEFIVDTGFDGELAVPASFIARLDVQYENTQRVILADGNEQTQPFFRIEVEAFADEDGVPRQTELVALAGGNPLLGIVLLSEQLVTLEMTENGEVTVEPL